MKAVVPREVRAGETRVALVPESVRKLVQAGIEVTLESGAGGTASFTDEQYAEAGAGIEADVERARKVVTNLVHNAIKFTPSGGSVVVGAEVAGAEVVFSVKKNPVKAGDMVLSVENVCAENDRGAPSRARGPPPGGGPRRRGGEQEQEGDQKQGSSRFSNHARTPRIGVKSP